MSRQPDRISYGYDLSNEDLHEAIRAYLGIGPKPVMSIDWNAYGSSADANVRVVISEDE